MQNREREKKAEIKHFEKNQTEAKTEKEIIKKNMHSMHSIAWCNLKPTKS